MLLFAHTGITLGLVFTWDKGLNGWVPPFLKKISIPKLNSMSSAIDYRLVILGSMLPDIIDKPVGHIFFSETFENNGRIIAHTLLFFLILLAYGLFRIFQYHKSGMLVVAGCSGFHLVFDEMWLTSRTLFWPFQGWDFPATEYIDFAAWIKAVRDTASTEPVVYITETVGLIVLLVVSYYLISRKQVHQFILRGRIQ